MTRRTLLLAACLLLPGACANHSPADADFGNAVRQNMAAQAVEPLPPAERGPIEGSGQRAATAVGRYEAGTVKQPRQVETANIGAAIGGGRP